MTSLILTSTILLNFYAMPAVIEPKFDLEEVIQQLIYCESRGKQFAINRKEPHGESFGILQYRLSTLYHFADKYGIERKDVFDIDFQKEVARAMILNGRGNHWTCWKM